MQRLLPIALALAAVATSAQAHITLETAAAPVGSSYKAVLRVPHGCDGEDTVKVQVKMPEGLIAAKPMPKPGWTIDMASGPYAKPHDSYGTPLAEGVTTITWSGGALPDAYYDEFVFRGTLAADLEPGATLYMPIVQTCTCETDRWIEIPTAGQDPESLELPAPEPDAAARRRRRRRLIRGRRDAPPRASRPRLGARRRPRRGACPARASEPAAGAVLRRRRRRSCSPSPSRSARWSSAGSVPTAASATSLARVERTRVVVPVPPAAAGSQLLSWRVASADGHPVGGAFSFAIGAPSATPARRAGRRRPPSSPPPRAAFSACSSRSGSAAPLFAVARRSRRPGARPGPAPSPAPRPSPTVPAAALALATHGFDLLGSFRPPLATLAPEALASPFARTAGLAALAGLLALRPRPDRHPRRLGRRRALLRGLRPRRGRLPRLADPAGHGAPRRGVDLLARRPAPARRLGRLRPPRPRAGARPLLALALPLVGLLVASGAILAIVELGRPAALIDTAYGRLLCLKLVAVAAMLALAALNRLRLTPRLASRGSLARSATAELDARRAGARPRHRLPPDPAAAHLALAAAAPVEVDLQGSGIMAMLTLDPGRPGANGIAIDLMGRLAPTGVTLALSLPEKGIEPIRLPATADASGTWHAGPFLLPLAAPWTATLQIRVGDFDETTLSGTVPVGP